MKSAVAGTFTVLHSGHKELISKAFELGDEVFIGITSDQMIESSKKHKAYFETRKIAVNEFSLSFGKPFKIAEINDIYGPKEDMDSVDILVVSEETVSNAEKIQEDRKKRGIKPLEISIVPLKKSQTGVKISSTDILDGKYSKSGRIDVIDIAVGTLNPIKIEAVRNVFERIYGEVKITPCDVPSGVSEQPKEEQTREGAINRASAALGNHDLGVGIEAGVFERIDGLYDIQYCAIIDSTGRVTVGTGSGFAYPPNVAHLVRGGLTVGEAMQNIFGETDIGKRKGAVGYLSNGLIDRLKLTEQSIIAAMIPRLNDSYVNIELD